jgi:hypothetical protein
VPVTLAAAVRNPTDILIPTQAGTEGAGGDDDEDAAMGGGSAANSGMSFAAMDEGSGASGSHEEAADQGWVRWMIGGMAAGLRKADQMGGAAMSFVLTGCAKTGEYGSFVGMAVQFDLGVLQGEANSANGVADAVVGLSNLGGKGVNRLAGHTVVSERVMPDLSRDLFVYEGETAHNVSKFAGGNGLITIVTGGAGAAGAAGSGAKALQMTGFVLQANSTAMALGGGATVAPAAVAGVVGALGAVAGSIGQIAHMSVASGPPTGGGTAPNSANAQVVDPAEAVMGGPKDGQYIAYHGTTESGAENIATNGIDSALLGEAEEFQMSIDPAKAANFGAGAAKDAPGSLLKLVRFEIPEISS